MSYAVKRIDEIPGVPDPDPGDPGWKPLRHHFGLEAFDCPAGTCVALPDPEVRRSAIAVDPDTAVLVIGGTPGRPYEVSAWDAKWTTGLERA